MQDEFGWSIPDADSLDEFRFVFLGVDPSGRLLVTVYAFRSAKVRIISSRVASLAEARVYRERA
ncbi:MAG: Ribonuclease toxin, BrnT, of type toxin-antitoxin system [Pseudomonadota bacterium]